MTKLTPAMLLLCALSACEPPEARNAATNATMDADNAANASMANVSDNGGEPARSILRPEVAEPEEPPRIEPAEAVIGFGATPMKLDDAARESLDALIATPAMAAGGPITLRGHSDSRGTGARLSHRKGRGQGPDQPDRDRRRPAARAKCKSRWQRRSRRPSQKPPGRGDRRPADRGRAAAGHAASGGARGQDAIVFRAMLP